MKVSLKDISLIFLVVLAWGLNFVVIKVGLQGVPPLLLGALRFTVLLVPALFIPLPKIKFKWLIAYAGTIAFGQFSFLFSAIHFGMPAGLASLVLQSQAFITMILAAFFLNEKFKLKNCLALGIAILGLAIVSLDVGATTTVIGFFLTLCAAAFWGMGNVIIKQLYGVNLVSLTIWGGIVSIIPFSIASLIFEGVDVIKASITNISMKSVLSILYLGYIATGFGYVIWGKMLSKYPASLIAPFSLLVPVFGLASSAFFLDEALSGLTLLGSIVILFGLGMNILGSRTKRIPKK